LRQKYDLKPENKVLICPARLIDRKGIAAFLKAVKSMAAPNVALLVAGDGPDREKLENLASSITHIKVKFLGFCHTETMLDLYALSDVFLLPSFEDPNPLSVIEACYSGLPLLLSYRLGNYPETLVEGQNGWSFDPGDAESVREAMNQFIKTPFSKLLQMGKASFNIGREKFNTNAVVNHLIQSLEVALKASN
jgi:glycosyltransferase involved in cell wall biosynthesis